MAGAPSMPGIRRRGRCCDSRCSGRCCRRGRVGCRARSGWVDPAITGARHDHARRAEAALQSVMLMERRLNRMQGRPLSVQALDRCDRRTVCHYGQHGAGFDCLSVDLHSAGAALRSIATDMGSGETKVFPDQVDQQFSRFHRDGLARAVDLQGYHILPFSGFAHSFLRLRVMKLHLLRMRVRGRSREADVGDLDRHEDRIGNRGAQGREARSCLIVPFHRNP